MNPAISLCKSILKPALPFALIVAFCACKKETNPPPVATQFFFDKGFIFQEDFEPIATDWLYYNTDTVSTTVVKFIALDSSAISYTWTIESATYNTRDVRLNFPQEYLVSNRKLPISLSIRYKTESNIDTVKAFVKVLTFFNPCESKFNGIFKGSIDNASQTDSFRISTCAYNSLLADYSFYLENFQLGCGRYFDERPDSYVIGYKQILFSGLENFTCNSPTGIINLYNDSIVMIYRSFDNGMTEAPLDHVFRGVRK